MISEIDEILNSYAVNILREMALAADLPWARDAKLGREALVAKMRQDYFTEARIRASAAQLAPQERGVLDLIALYDEPVLTGVITRQAVAHGLAQPTPQNKSQPNVASVPYAWGYVGTPYDAQSAIVDDIIARLTWRGLLFSRFEKMLGAKNPFRLQYHPAILLYIPQEVRRHLPPSSALAAAPARPAWRPKLAMRSNPQALLRNLYLYWDFVRRNDIALTRTGLVPKRQLKAINKTLVAPDSRLDEARDEDEARLLRLLRDLLFNLGLLLHSPDGEHLRAAAARKEAPSFWAGSEEEQLRACLAYWSPPEKGSAAPRYGPEPTYLRPRRALIAALRRLKGTEWVEIERFIENLTSHDINFMFPDHGKALASRGEWYDSSSSGFYGPAKVVVAEMEKAERAFILGELGDAPFVLGLLDLGMEVENGPLSGLRLTPLGRRLLGLSPAAPSLADQGAPAEQDAGRVVAQPNYQIMALGPVSLSTLAQLDSFADRERADLSVFEYRLSRESVYRAQQAGLTLAEITRALDEIAHNDIPQNVRRSLAEWGANYERIVFRSGVSLLQAATPQLLQRLLDTPAVRARLGQAINDRVAMIAPGADEALLEALMAQGLLPSAAQVGADEHSVEVREDGVLRPAHAAPSLSALGRLARLAEPTEDGAWRLTPASATRGGVGREAAQRLLDELAALSRGALPEALVNRVKAWGQYYGVAAIETLTLIAFESQAALDELRSRPELGPYLAPFPSEGRALAAVRAEHLPQVREALGRLGVAIKG